MPTLPRASTTVEQVAGGNAKGSQLIAVIAPVATNADSVPRQFGSAKAVLDYHGYNEGVEYVDMHVAETRLPVLFVGVPIEVPGVIGSENTTGNGGTATTSLTAGASGVLAEHDGVITVITGGIAGTDPIVLGVSLDGGRTTKRVRLGTALTYAIPYVGVTLTVVAGTLVAGETIHTWHGSQPRGDAAGLTLARTNLAAQQRAVRSILIVGDCVTGDAAAAAQTLAESYASANERFVGVRVQVKDLDRATASSGGSAMFDNEDSTITRDEGSWISDGFAVGQTVTIDGTAAGANDGEFTVTAVTSTVLTVEESVSDLTADLEDVTITSHQSQTDWLTDIESEYANIDGAYRVNLGAGRGRKLSQITGYMPRRPVQWAASVRQYQHDFHIPTWKRDEGPLSGWTLLDSDGATAELDDRLAGGAGISARFTTFTSLANGPQGAFITTDLTRAEDSTALSYQHNVDVTNLAQTIVHRATERCIGSVLVLNTDGSGTATSDSLATIAARVNAALQRGVLVDTGEGVRASGAVWEPSSDDVLSGAEALLTGTLTLTLNGTIHSVSTAIKVQ